MAEQPSNPRELPDKAASELSAGLGKIKLCLFCRHCEFDKGHIYSEYTAEDPSINCLKWLNSYCEVERNDFAVWSRKAETCESYEPDA